MSRIVGFSGVEESVSKFQGVSYGVYDIMSQRKDTVQHDGELWR